jgi:glutamate N-acetyltransferase / amino-acid N-acetyltransferase
MAVGEYTLPVMHSVSGVRLGTACAGIKKPGRRDLVLIEIAEGSSTAAVFTQNAFCAAPVTVAREHLHACGNEPRFLLVNTGNANAGTGPSGLENARACVETVASLAEVAAESVLPFSTGVIGEPLPVEVIQAGVPEAQADLNEEGWASAAEGILTTDTRPKGSSVQFVCEGVTYTVTGIAKGSGMIRPDMATMLAYVATDANVSADLLQSLLAQSVGKSFNRVTVDGDTSTNDACVLIATGAASSTVLDSDQSELYEALSKALEQVCVELATGLVKDGEGASKFVTVEINGGASEQESLDVAYTIAHSPLVKTALFASDPNWGRLLAAIGRAGVEDLDVERIDLYLNDVLIAQKGGRADSYTEEQGASAMAPEEITIRVELNRGDCSTTVWTSDFSYDYVRINAEYRT